MEIKKRINEINHQIFKLQTERDEIQSDCPHEETELVSYSWRPGASHYANACVECGKPVWSKSPPYIINEDERK